MRVFGAVGRPAGKCGFVGLLLRHRAEPLQPQQLALPFFPCVGDRSVFGGVADAGRRVGLLRRRDDFQPSCAQVDLHRVRPFDDIGHGVGRDVLLRVARKTVDHREVALADSLRRDGEVARRAVGYVFAAEFRRSVLAVGIDAEEREVARMARPHPVVGIAAELADRRRRSCHETDVGVVAVYEQEILIAVKERLDIGPAVGSPNRRVDHPGRIEPDQRVAARLGQIVPHPVKHLRGHVLHADQKRHVQAGVG